MEPACEVQVREERFYSPSLKNFSERKILLLLLLLLLLPFAVFGKSIPVLQLHELVFPTTQSGLKRQNAGQNFKNENHYVFSTIESCRVGIPAYYVKRRESYPLYLRKYGISKLFIGIACVSQSRS